MKKTLLSLSIAAAAVSMPAQAADIGGGLDLSGNLALTSNYIWRGQSQTNDEEAIQGGLDLAHESGLYVGTWGSNIGTGSEFDYYGGYATELGGISVDLGVIAYRYPKASSSNFEETYLSVGTSVGSVDLGAMIYDGHDAAQGGWELSAGTSMAGLGFSATYGDYDGGDAAGTYAGKYFSIGVSKELLSEKWPVEVSLAYTDFDADAGSTSDEDDIVFTVSKSF
jgi:uncharacterized protein (TIGR02001 family)